MSIIKKCYHYLTPCFYHRKKSSKKKEISTKKAALEAEKEIAAKEAALKINRFAKNQLKKIHFRKLNILIKQDYICYKTKQKLTYENSIILRRKKAIHVNYMHELLTKIYYLNKTESTDIISADIIKTKKRFNYEILHSQLTIEQQYIIKSLKNIILTSNKSLNSFSECSVEQLNDAINTFKNTNNLNTNKLLNILTEPEIRFWDPILFEKSDKIRNRKLNVLDPDQKMLFQKIFNIGFKNFKSTMKYLKPEAPLNTKEGQDKFIKDNFNKMKGILREIIKNGYTRDLKVIGITETFTKEEVLKLLDNDTIKYLQPEFHKIIKALQEEESYICHPLFLDCFCAPAN